MQLEVRMYRADLHGGLCSRRETEWANFMVSYDHANHAMGSGLGLKNLPCVPNTLVASISRASTVAESHYQKHYFQQRQYWLYVEQMFIHMFLFRESLEENWRSKCKCYYLTNNKISFPIYPRVAILRRSLKLASNRKMH